jgi:hypothetical protein
MIVLTHRMICTFSSPFRLFHLIPLAFHPTPRKGDSNFCQFDRIPSTFQLKFRIEFQTDKRFGEDQKTFDISQYSLESSLIMSNYSFFHKSIRLPLVILNLRAFSSKSSYFIFNTISDNRIFLKYLLIEYVNNVISFGH